MQLARYSSEAQSDLLGAHWPRCSRTQTVCARGDLLQLDKIAGGNNCLQSKDNFWTTHPGSGADGASQDQTEVIVALLSKGPVGPSDGLAWLGNRSDWLKATCNADGALPRVEPRRLEAPRGPGATVLPDKILLGNARTHLGLNFEVGSPRYRDGRYMYLSEHVHTGRLSPAYYFTFEVYQVTAS